MKVESVNEEESTHSSTDEFRRAISRVAVAQLCQSVGFESVQLSALDALSELVIRYVCEVSKAAQFHANLSGRTACSVFDILRVMGEVEEDGHGSGSDASGEVIMRYVEAVDGQVTPFSVSLPRFPIACWVKRRVSFARNGDAPPGKHIPDWLPKLPDPHTYIQTPVWDERTSDPKEEKVEQARQRRKAERSLLNLEQRLAIANGGGGGKREIGIFPAVVANTPTILMEDGEVDPLPLEDGVMEKKRSRSSSVVDAFKPVIEALENGTLDAAASGCVPRKERMVFRFGFNKRTFDMGAHLGGVKRSRIGSLRALGVDEKDDKKRRAQVIIRDSMDDPQELHQL